MENGQVQDVLTMQLINSVYDFHSDYEIDLVDESGISSPIEIHPEVTEAPEAMQGALVDFSYYYAGNLELVIKTYPSYIMDISSERYGGIVNVTADGDGFVRLLFPEAIEQTTHQSGDTVYYVVYDASNLEVGRGEYIIP